MQLTLGPVLFNWRADIWRDFYFRIADEAPVDVVVVGEVVCSKRSPFFADHLPAVIDRLQTAGKQVIAASLLLVSLPRERRQMAELSAGDDLMVEVNDLSCLQPLIGRPHSIGPFVNVYNEATAAYFAERGARRICLPPELPIDSVATIAAAVPAVVTEVFAFGKVPLAISGRCYHARIHKLSKDNCQFVCEKDPDGLAVKTLDGSGFLSVNGVQTLSHTCASLIGDISALKAAGAGALRLSPHSCDMVKVAGLFRDVIDGRREAGAAHEALGEIYTETPFSNGFLHAVPGAEYVVAQA